MATTPRTRSRSIAVTVAVAFSVLFVSILLVVSGIQLFFSFQTQREGVLTQQQLIAQEAASTVRTFVEDKFQQLDAAVRIGSLSTASPAERQLVLDKLLGSELAFRQIILFDLAGSELARVTRRSSLLPAQPPNYYAEDLFARVRERDVYVSVVSVDPETSEPTVAIGVPVIDIFGDVHGALLAELNLKFMWDVIDGIRVGETGVAYVVDRYGRLIAFGDTSRVLRGENVGDLAEVRAFMTGVPAAGDGFLNRSSGIFGTSVMDTSVALGVPDWAVIVEMPLEEAYAREIRNLWLSGIMIGFFVIMMIVASANLSRRIARPINRLSEVANAIAEGDLNRRAQVESRDEIGDLAHSFNAMTERLLAAIDNLRAEENLTAAERNKLSIILSGVTNAVIAVDLERKIILFNRAAEALTGSAAREVMGRPIGEVVHLYDEKNNEINPGIYSPIIQDRDGVVFSQNGLLLKNQGGQDRYVNLIAGAIPEGRSIKLGCILTFHDVTEERKLDAIKQQFISIAAHQLRTPLSGIKWALSLLSGPSGGPLADSQRVLVMKSYESVNRLIVLVNDLLSADRIESGRAKFTFVPTNIIDLARNVLFELTPQLRHKRLQVTLESTGDIPELMLDQEQMRAVFQNIFENAIRYSPEGSTIKLKIAAELDQVRVAIADSGIGIPKEAEGRIFTRFFRAANATALEPNGSGLGLYIVKQIIEQHHGRIWFESEEGNGTTFFISLPVRGPGTTPAPLA